MARARGVVVPAVVAGLEVTWVYGLLTVAAGAAGLEVRAIWLPVVFAVSWGLASTLRGLRVRWWAALALSWLVWAAATLAAIKVLLFPESGWSDPAVLLVCFGGALLWWLGRRPAHVRPGFARVMGEFQFGLMVLVAAFCLSYLLGREPADAIAVGVIYMTLGLVGAAAAAQGGQEGQGRPEFGRQGSWWGMLLVSVTAILLLGLLVGAVITPEFVHVMVRGLAWLWRQVDGVLMAIANRFAGQQAGGSPGAVASSTTTTEIAADTFGFTFRLPAWLTGGARVVWTMVVAGSVLLAAWRVASQAFGRLRGRATDDRGEVERLKGAFRLDMAAWFKRALAWLRGLGRLTPGGGPVQQVDPGAASVRELYQRLLRWAAGSGLVRDGATTPHEFECRLAEALPEHAEQFRAITREYVKARYSGVAPTDEELSVAKHAWRTVRKG